ncbi:MAG: 4-hydroxy-tetrahydrodipicolinate synthase [Candidatus Bathyarchaeia archaeon]
MPLDARELRGIIPALVTPFTSSDEVDNEALRRLVEFVLDHRVHAVMTTGGNGEFPHLTSEERRRVLEVVVDEVNGRIPVIACTATCSTKEAVALSLHAKDAGADAVILTPPYYFGLPDESLYNHYVAVAERSGLPVVVYNNPVYAGHNISPRLMARLAEVEGIIGLKQSNSDISETLEIIRFVGEKIAVLTGIDSQLFPVLAIGGRGVFSTAACVIPGLMVEVYDAYQSGDIAKARELHLKLQALNRFFEYEPGYVAPCKEALSMLGIPCGDVRAPLPRLTQREREDLKAALEQLGLLKRGS